MDRVTTSSGQVLQIVLTGLLAVALVGFAAGCGGGGSNGGGDDGGGNGDGDDGLTAPAAPSNLTTDASDGAVGLDWGSVDAADSYNVYRSTSPTDGVSGSALNTEITQSSYTDQTPTNGTTYYYRVTAVKSEDGETAESDGSGEEASTPFTSPTGLTGTSGNAQIDLDWSVADGAETYNVYRSTSPIDGTEGDPVATGVSEASYSDQDVENGTTYHYRVSSVNPEEEESGASGEDSRTPFATPTDVTGTSGDSQIDLTWSAADGAETYSVYRSTSSFDDVSGMDPLASDVSVTDYTDNSAENGTKYYYRLTSVNPQEEESVVSNEVEKTPFEDPDRP